MFSDLRFAFRSLVKSPGFATVAVLTLALGIGANTAIFTLFDAMVLRPVAVKEPQRLAVLLPDELAPRASVGSYGLAYPLYRALRDDNAVFDGVLCHFRRFANLAARDQTERVTTELVSGNYFEVLGVPAALGRTLTPDDDRQSGGHPVAVLSHQYWMSAFGGDPTVLGQALHLNGQLLTIVGVSAKGFSGLDLDAEPQIYVPVTMVGVLFPSMATVGVNLENPGIRWVRVFARLRQSVTLNQAQAAVQPLYRTWTQSAIATGAFAHVEPSERARIAESSLLVRAGATGVSNLRANWSTPLRVLGIMTGILLLLTCVNVATLFLGRGLARQGEIAVRLALGAGRVRVLRQLFTEALLIAVMGAVAGMWLAPFATDLLVPLLPVDGETPPNLTIALNGPILFVTAASAALAAVLAGLVPALLATRLDLAPVLKQSASRLPPHGRIRQALVVVQVSLSVLLLFVSGLFVRSLHGLNVRSPGFATHSIVAFGVDPVSNGYSQDRADEIYRRVQERLATATGVDGAAFGLVRLLGGTDVWKFGSAVDGLPAPSGGDQIISFNAVSPEYFRTLHIPLRAGRDFRGSDRADSPPVVIVNESFVRQFMGNVEPLGRYAWLPGQREYRKAEIVGVVADTHYESVQGRSPAQVFVPYPQLFTPSGMNGYVASTLPVERVVSLIRTAVHEIDPTLPINSVRTMEQQRDRALGRERMIAVLASAFGVLATLMAGVGLFGVLSYSVARRTRELGLRIALGAPRARVAALVVREVLVVCGLGLAIALPLGWAGGRLVASQLDGVAPTDPLSAAGVGLVLLLVALAACWLPARRATHINPVDALRAE